MRKKVLGLLMAAMAISTIGAFAQSENTTETTVCTAQKGECQKEGKGKKCHKKGDRKAKMNAFEGIELTQEQQQQIAQLKAECKAKKEADKAEKKKAKAEARAQFNEKVSQILTPEQYAQYKANCDSIKANKKSDKKIKKKVMGKKGDGKGKEMRRGEKRD